MRKMRRRKFKGREREKTPPAFVNVPMKVRHREVDEAIIQVGDTIIMVQDTTTKQLKLLHQYLQQQQQQKLTACRELP